MALNDKATLVIGAGNYFTAPSPGEEAPKDLTAVTAPWVNMGHTSIEDIMTFDSEGGESSVLGTLQNPSLRTTRSNSTDTISISLQQFDTPSLKFFFGKNSGEGDLVKVGGTAKWLRVKSKPQATECAFLAVYVDADSLFALHVPRCEILKGDNLEFGDTESLAGLPLAITPLQHGSNDWTYQITPLGEV